MHEDATRPEAPLETPSYVVDADAPRRPPLDRGEVVGRYIILDELGTGAMGAVYRAYDPELDRKVALKLILAQLGSVEATVAARVRLQREAQAMAKLSHPNVIAVYDVGTFGNEVFMAMELVDGISLSEWIARHWESEVSRSAGGWRKVRDLFLQAGRGLAAAHAAGLIHRDFKPANVLVGNDGRVRVLDFGLARPTDTPSHDARAPAGSTGEFRRADVDAELTMAGTVMGTPAYMAPEQHRSNDIDARADQYAFCVAFYEALYGTRPFPSGTIRAQYEAKLAPLPAPPADIAVPPWLHAVIVRGLAESADDRFPNMVALILRLARRPTRRRRAWLVGGAALAGVLGGAVAVSAIPSSEADTCPPAEERLDGIWDPDQKRDVAAAFDATGVVYAGAALDGLSSVIDEYVASWSQMYEEACAAEAAPSSTQDTAALRRECLERRLTELGELTSLLGQADPQIVEFSISAAHELNAIEICADDRSLARRLQPPADPEVRSRVEQVRSTLSRARTLRDAGKYEAALERVGGVMDAASEYEPVLAEALYMRGTLEEALGDHREAGETLHQAAWTATAAHHDEAAARAWIALIYNVGYHQADYAYAERIAGLARAALRGAGEDPDLTATWFNNVAAVAHQRGAYERALGYQENALNLLETLLGPKSPRVARSLDNLGLELRALGRHTKALEAHRRALEIQRSALGEAHPGLISSLNHIGNVHYSQRELDQATEHYRRACEIAEHAYREPHRSHADCLGNLGAVDFLRGDLERAEARHREVLELRLQQLGPDHPEVASALNNLALAVAAAGRTNEALELHQRALAIKRTSLGAAHPSLARSLANIGRLLLALDSPRTALSRLEQARQILETSLGPEHPELGPVLSALARARIAVDDRAGALEAATRAVELLERGPSPQRLAEARFALARALPEERLDFAVEQAQLARDAHASAGEGSAAELGAIDAWLATNRR